MLSRFVRLPALMTAFLAAGLLVGCSSPQYLLGLEEEVAFLDENLVPIESIEGPLYGWGAGEGAARPDTPPEPVEGMQALLESASYPEGARRRCAEGQVVVRFVVDEDGRVIAAEPAQRADPDLDVAATAAVARSKFTPGMQNGEPVKVVARVPFTFDMPASRCPAGRMDGDADVRYR